MPHVVTPTRILGLAGSMRQRSYNRMLLYAARDIAADDVEIVPWERLKTIPPFDEDDEHLPGPAVADLRESIDKAGAILIVTPEYNGSIPGQLKNALDWASRPRRGAVLRDAPVAVIGTSPSRGAARRAQSDARHVLTRAGAKVLDIELAITRPQEQFDSEGRLIDEQLRAQLRSVVSALASAGADVAGRTIGNFDPILQRSETSDVRRGQTQLV